MLDIGIIGAGIGGLSAALALTRACPSSTITIFEKSQFRNETGAAIIIGPNGTRILSLWGFDFAQAGALDYVQMRRIKADTIEEDSTEQFESIEELYGARWLMFHRADLHAGLTRLVRKQSERMHLRLGEAVEAIDPDKGTITLSNGEIVQKDLLIVADGAHSNLISTIIGRDYPVIKSPMSMYRFLQPMNSILADPQTSQFYHNQPSGFTTFYKSEVGRPGLLLNTYPCRGGELLYAALLHPTKPKERDVEGWDSPASIQDILDDAKGFHPSVRAICEGATDVKVYRNMWRDPVETLVKSRAILIGDAAHLMLPTHGQGASQALEDAMALEVLFDKSTKSDDVPHRAQLFNKLRVPRVSAVQTISNKMMGSPDKMTSEVKRYYDRPVPGPGAKTFSKEYNDFFFLYDVAEEARKILRL
ncbi:hypothetical protein LTS08_003507 [Lithohypha guttulata]|nr:hypothetical protein LTS08_003507 [Lithohypha guttulata]